MALDSPEIYPVADLALMASATPYLVRIDAMAKGYHAKGIRLIALLKFMPGNPGSQYSLGGVDLASATVDYITRIGVTQDVAEEIAAKVATYDMDREIPLLVVNWRNLDDIRFSFEMRPLETDSLSSIMDVGSYKVISVKGM